MYEYVPVLQYSCMRQPMHLLDLAVPVLKYQYRYDTCMSYRYRTSGPDVYHVLYRHAMCIYQQYSKTSTYSVARYRYRHRYDGSVNPGTS